jgi:hypothetical protein
MNLRSLSLLSLFGLFQMGCGLLGSGVEVRSVSSSVQRPSNVAIYVAVEDEKLPVGGLEAKNFQIYEDDVPVDATHSKLTLLSRDDVAVHHAVVLIDLSGSPDEATRNSIAKGASHLVEKLRQDQGVTVLGFDGSPKLHPLGEFPRSSDTTVPEVKGISTFRSADESRNLNGAIVQGLDQLDARLMRQKKPVRVGTLVIFTRGDDLAGRVAADSVWEKLRSTPHEIYGIGIDSPDAHQLDDMARNGVKKSANVSDAPIAFENMAIEHGHPAQASSRQVLLGPVLLARPQRHQARARRSATRRQGRPNRQGFARSRARRHGLLRRLRSRSTTELRQEPLGTRHVGTRARAGARG